MKELPLVSIVIPVGGNRYKDTSKLRASVESLFNQTFPHIEVILVVDEDNTDVKSMVFSKPVRFIDFPGIEGEGRDTIQRAVYGWDQARGQILALSGVSLIWSPKLISTALRIMKDKGVDAVDGITRRLPGDRRFLALFQDKALVTEFPLNREDLLLTLDNYPQVSRLPTLTSFFMTKDFYLRFGWTLPITPSDGWEDFDAIRRIIEAGGGVFLSNKLVAFRNHTLSLRLGKQFSSGCSAARYLFDHPTDVYVRRRLKLTLIVLFVFTISLVGWLALSSLYGLSVGTTILTIVGLGVLFFLGWYNSIITGLWQAWFFPPLVLLQTGIWISGFVYEVLNGNHKDLDFILWLHLTR